MTDALPIWVWWRPLWLMTPGVLPGAAATRFNGQAHSSTKLILWLGDATPRIAVEPKGKEADACDSRVGENGFPGRGNSLNKQSLPPRTLLPARLRRKVRRTLMIRRRTKGS